MLNQLNYFENASPSIWWKNYTTYHIANGVGCGPVDATAAQAAGTIIVASPNENGMPCTLQSIVDAWNPFDPVGYMFFSAAPSLRSYGNFNPYFPVSLVKPVWYTGWSQTLPQNIASVYPNSAVGILNVNCTLTLDFPSPNPQLQIIHTAGWGQIWLMNIAFGVIVMLVAVAKLSLFVHMEGGVKLSLPQVVLSLCFLTGFFWFLVYGILGGNTKLDTAIVPTDSVAAVSQMSYGFCYTSLIVLGFYFGEISQLSSMQKVPGLDKMRIPAAIFVALLWAVVISNQATDASDPTPFNGFSPGLLQNFFFAWLGVVVPFFTSAILLWGSINLLRAMPTSSVKSPFIRVAVVSFSSFAIMWSLILVGFINFFGPPPTGQTTTWGAFTVYQYVCLREIFWGLGYCIISVLACSLFNVSVAKEIELSKSATSSTSSSSKSKSGSSSSSSSSDPVIEL